MAYYLLLSRSITHAQRMSGTLEKMGIPAGIFRPPLGLSEHGCAYAVRIGESRLQPALARLRQQDLLPVRIVLYRDGAYSEVRA